MLTVEPVTLDFKIKGFQGDARAIMTGPEKSYRGDIEWEFNEKILKKVPNLVACRDHRKTIHRLKSDTRDSDLKSMFGDKLVQKASPWMASFLYRVLHLEEFEDVIRDNVTYIEYVKIGFLLKTTYVVEYYRQGGFWNVSLTEFNEQIRQANRHGRDACVVLSS
jgi:hypothetical protein